MLPMASKREQQGLPDELWEKILESVDDNSVTAFASACKQLRRVQQRSGRRLRTSLRFFSISEDDVSRPPPKHEQMSEDWCLWCMELSLLTDRSRRKEKERRSLINAAAVLGHLDALKYWEEQNREQKSFFLDSRSPFDEQTCAFAAAGGRLDVLKWLREGCWGRHPNWDKRTCQWAASAGHLKVLKYAHEQGCPWDAGTCEYAAQEGHLEVLKYAHENGCPWNEWICHAAAGGGRWDTLKYAHEHGCPWNAERIRRLVAAKGDREMIEYVEREIAKTTGPI